MVATVVAVVSNVTKVYTAVLLFWAELYYIASDASQVRMRTHTQYASAIPRRSVLPRASLLSFPFLRRAGARASVRASVSGVGVGETRRRFSGDAHRSPHRRLRAPAAPTPPPPPARHGRSRRRRCGAACYVGGGAALPMRVAMTIR